MKTAKDIMTPNPRFIGSGEQLKDTIEMFINYGLHYSPVVTPMGEILGFLSEFGLVKASLRHFLDTDKQEKVINHQDLLEEAITVYEDDSLDEVIKAMMKSPTRRVLVLNKTPRMIGIISPKDLLKYLSGEKGKAVDFKKELENAREEIRKIMDQLKVAQYNLGKFQALTDDLPVMLFSADVSGKIILANKRIHETLRYNHGELIGKNLTDLYPHTVNHEIIDIFTQVKDSGLQTSNYSSMQSKTGEKIRVDASWAPWRDESGKFLGTLTLSKEINSEALLRALHGIGKDKDDKAP